MSMKNSNDIGNRTRDLPACNAVPQTTAPQRAPNETCKDELFEKGHLLDPRPLDTLPLTTASINGCVIIPRERTLSFTHTVTACLDSHECFLSERRE
jgi:hypothetical protein